MPAQSAGFQRRSDLISQIPEANETSTQAAAACNCPIMSADMSPAAQPFTLAPTRSRKPPRLMRPARKKQPRAVAGSSAMRCRLQRSLSSPLRLDLDETTRPIRTGLERAPPAKAETSQSSWCRLCAETRCLRLDLDETRTPVTTGFKRTPRALPES
jgi:hypothetical protein